jgi:hypothetical protein
VDSGHYSGLYYIKTMKKGSKQHKRERKKERQAQEYCESSKGSIEVYRDMEGTLNDGLSQNEDHHGNEKEDL